MQRGGVRIAAEELGVGAQHVVVHVWDHPPAAGAAAHGDDAHERIRAALAPGDWPALLTSSADDAFEGADNVRRWSVGLPHVTTRIVPGAAHAMGIYYDIREDVLAAVRSWVR